AFGHPDVTSPSIVPPRARERARIENLRVRSIGGAFVNGQHRASSCCGDGRPCRHRQQAPLGRVRRLETRWKGTLSGLQRSTLSGRCRGGLQAAAPPPVSVARSRVPGKPSCPSVPLPERRAGWMVYLSASFFRAEFRSLSAYSIGTPNEFPSNFESTAYSTAITTPCR